jgi:alpha-amylase
MKVLKRIGRWSLMGCFLSLAASIFAANTDIMIEGFDWGANYSTWYSTIAGNAPTIGSAGITMIWLPPPTATADTHGYLPTEWYDLNASPYGTQANLQNCISAYHAQGIKCLADIVIQHRCGDATADCDFSNPVFGEGEGSTNTDAPDNCRAICDNDPCGCGSGAPDTYVVYGAARNLDQTWSVTESTIEAWMNWLKSTNNAGFDGWRYDMCVGYAPQYVGTYNSATSPYFSVGEYWDTDTSDLISFVNSSGSTAFDFATKSTLDAVFNNNNYSYLDYNGGAPGLIGSKDTMAVTFVDDHDTAAVGGQDLLPMPSAGIQQAYVYILTHPGVPCIFWPQYWANQSLINTLISIRKAQGITAASTLSIQSCNSGLYAAIINGNTAMKIGPNSWSPSGNWNLATSGNNYAVWTAGYTAKYSNMDLRGTMNSWGNTAMSLVANDTWQVTVNLTANTTYQFKFDASGDWTSGENWGGTGTGSSGTAVVNAGNLSYTTTTAGNYTFIFNDSTLAYSIQ